MLTIKKIIGLVILIAFFLHPAFTENANGGYGFSLSPSIGILYGHSEEIVYHYPKNNLYLSQLLWDMKPLAYVGLGVDFGPLDPSGKQGFIAALSFKAGLPFKSGLIKDSDWDNTDPYYKTRYSQHDAYFETAFLLDVSAGYFQRFVNSLALSIYGEFSFMHYSWSAADGYSQYASLTQEGIYLPWDNNIPKSYFYGEVLRYRQNWLIFSPGLSLDWDMNRLFSLKTCFNYTPLIYCAARDDHLPNLPGHTTYFDYLSFGHYFKSSGELIFSASENTRLSLSLSHKYITGSRGDTFFQSRRYEDEAGVGHSAIDLGLAVKFRLTSRN